MPAEIESQWQVIAGVAQLVHLPPVADEFKLIAFEIAKKCELADKQQLVLVLNHLHVCMRTSACDPRNSQP